ncbi:DUF551 domain-containing protein [Paenibacillus senegalensis]|uniref:DUF551 domain-containing protein n=1 Tax=Paenibacillus senegalensis TaxID=1465766 RepID=UPI000288284D|nr:DUF551 domain-containing protein [Paenibacillus senegalensis]
MSKVCKKHQENPAIIYSKCIGCEIEMLQQLIKEKEQLLKWFRERQDNWVSVKDRLPEQEGYYLTYTQQAGIFTTRFIGGEVRAFTDMLGFAAYPGITHWMPLPEPPKEAEQE